MNPELFKVIVDTVILLLSAVITAYVIPWLESRIGEQKYDTLVKYITLAIRSAEQLFTEEEWKEKKEYVLGLAQGWIATNLKLDMSDEQLDSIIEGLVNSVKHAEG